jgi:hypothetical protein
MAEPREATLHEAATLSLRGIAVGGGVIVGGIALALAVPWLVIAKASVPDYAPNDAARPAMRGPIQETAPLEDIGAFRRDEMRYLESDGIDPATGRPHISIEHAMELLASRASSAAEKKR